MLFALRTFFLHRGSQSAAQPVRAINDDPIARRNMIQEIELRRLVGLPIIILSNEPGNVRVGIGRKVIQITKSNSPTLVYDDLLTGEEFICFGMTFPYTHQKFDALNAMDVNSRIALFYFRDSNIEVSKTPVEPLVAPDEWSRIVKDELEKKFPGGLPEEGDDVEVE